MNRAHDPLANLADALGEDIVAAPAALLAAEAARERGGSLGVAAAFDRIVARAERRARWRRLKQRLRAFVPSMAALASWPSAMAAVASIAVIVVAGDLYLHVGVDRSPYLTAAPVLAPGSDAAASRREVAPPPLAFGEERRGDADKVVAAPAGAPAAKPPEPAAAYAPRRIATVRIGGSADVAAPAPPRPAPAPADAARRITTMRITESGGVAAPPLAATRPASAGLIEPLPFSEDRDQPRAAKRARAAAAPPAQPPQQLAAVPAQQPAPASAPLDRPAAGRDAVPTFAWPLRAGSLADARPAKPDARSDGLGLDIAVPVGTPIHAAADGLVVYADDEQGLGKLVLVRHSGGFVTAYAHAERILVRVGDSVKRGQVIAKSGRTVAAPLLHFEIRRGATPVDAKQYLPALQ
jgi:murein DD-endopeptidase MepM/ murein hydrolase activator NlpD